MRVAALDAVDARLYDLIRLGTPTQLALMKDLDDASLSRSSLQYRLGRLVSWSLIQVTRQGRFSVYQAVRLGLPAEHS